MQNFDNSQSKINLMRAFAGECQARSRYNFASNFCKEHNLFNVSKIFLYTAGQELQHAKVFYDFLATNEKQSIDINASYPIDNCCDVLTMLYSAYENEMEEYEKDYLSFSNVAKEEGFVEISAIFKLISEVEHTHALRYDYLIKLLENDSLYTSINEEKWVCLNCGHIYKGTEVPKICPVCKYERDYFLNEKLAPYCI